MYAFSRKSCSILYISVAKEDAEMLVKALEVIDDPVRVSVLQRGFISVMQDPVA